MAVVQNPFQLIAARLFGGLLIGIMPAIAAMVVAETPAARVGPAVGVVSSASAIGASIGPFLGGLLALLVDLRLVFAASGAFIFAFLPFIHALVIETPRNAFREHSNLGVVTNLRAQITVRARAVIAGLFLLQFSFGATQQLVVVSIIQIDPAHAKLVTGLAFGIAGGATALASILYARFASRFGYVRVVMSAAAAMSISIALLPLAPTSMLLAGSMAGFGIFYGVLWPSLTTMTGLSVSKSVVATVFGISTSAASVGFGLGPFLCGLVASRYSVGAGLLLAAVAIMLLVPILFLWAREPSRQVTP
jgi:DHA1 family multidrug resistance protein-like MFS transporter